ncbi:hypothetical protein LBMAG42_44730 [Deltaproteobacteria bacterium]|nr:hypothetical protein LBMAG42_44730 [Deltaproteobacteria bacterium]
MQTSPESPAVTERPLAWTKGAPLNPAGPNTLTDAILGLESLPGAWLHTGGQTERRSLEGAELLALARRWRTALHAVGVREGDRVALCMPNGESFVGAFFGALLAGAAAVPLSWPVSALDAERKLLALGPLLRVADVRAVVTEPWMPLQVLAQLASAPVVTEPAAIAHGRDANPSPESTALLQFTSGSLGLPRGAELSHRAVSTCVRAMVQAMALGPSDVGVSWLPLFHDMGLIGGLLAPVFAHFPVHLLTPGEFLLHPARWLTRVAEVGGTVAAAPDFAWRLLARRAPHFTGDLSRWRIGLDGAEPVHRTTLDAFHARFAQNHFPATTLRPAYGLAENTLAATLYNPAFPVPDFHGALRLVPSSGAPIPGVDVRIIAGGGQVAREGDEGNIQVRSGSLMNGYFRDEAASLAALPGGWLETGDLGVLRSGQLYVTGRAKEMLIQNGTKFHPYDLERAAADSVDAAIAGAAAFAIAGPEGERLVMAVEVPPGFKGDVVRHVRGALLEALGVRVDVVLPLRPGELPRTTSGKVRRGQAASLLAERADA